MAVPACDNKERLQKYIVRARGVQQSRKRKLFINAQAFCAVEEKGMKVFRKPTQIVVKDEQKQQSSGKVESIPVFKERKRKDDVVSVKSSTRNTPSHRE